MDRRTFLQFMGVSSAATVASTALAKLPEAESQIILLDKPKDIIIANKIPDYDFIINYVIEIKFLRDENMTWFHTPDLIPKDMAQRFGPISVTIELKCYTEQKEFDFYNFDTCRAGIFTFDIKENKQLYNVEDLNGQRFVMESYRLYERVGKHSVADITARRLA